MKFTLRPYQRDAVRATIRSFLKTVGGIGPFTKVLLVAATGAGKTIMAAALAWWISSGQIDGKPGGNGRILLLADTDELVTQMADKVLQATGMIADIEKASSYASMHSPVVVGSIQTLASRFDRWPPGHFDLIVADEAHLSLAANWQRVLCHFHGGGALVLGITATPERGDGQSLMGFYEHVSFEIGLFELINMGMLAPLTVQVCPVEIDLRTLKTKSTGEDAGSFDENELAESIMPYWHAIIDQWEIHASDRKTLWFHSSVKASKRFAQVMQERGHTCLHIDGKSKNRDVIRAEFEESRVMNLCNSKLLQKGYDCDDITCIVDLSPGKSRVDFFQKIGRGTRLAIEKGKTDCLILDFMWKVEEIGLQRPASLIATTEESEEAISQILATGKRMKLHDASAAAETERQSAIIERLKRFAGKQGKRFDVRDLGAIFKQPDLIDYVPRSPWEKMGITGAQKSLLEAAGINIESVRGLGHARKILETLAARRSHGLAQAKQVLQLAAAGIEEAHQYTFAEAMETLNRMIEDAPEAPEPAALETKNATVPYLRGMNPND